jgi:murein DD-endopeptidase MepM/ murein hydrolase activator NlpD
MLTQNSLTQERKLKLRWFVALSSLPLLGVVTAFGIMPQNQIPPTGSKTVIEAIALPAAQPAAISTTFWRDDRVQRGDTVAEELRRLNVDDSEASNYLRNDPAAESFRQLAIGKSVQAETSADGGLLALRYLSNDGSQIIIEKSGNGFQTHTLPAQLEQRVFMRTGEIKTSLFAATDAANLPDPAANQLADIFGGDIDFHHDLRKGDKFTVVYEMTYSNGEPLRAGRILAAEFINRGKSYRAVYFQSDDGHGDYYTPAGKSMHKAFLRSPVEFSRISSGFTTARFHPILHKWRAHKGVDFAAPIGTKVKATADGVVSFVGKETGYGNVIILKHQTHFSTVYGHLSRFAKNLHRGQHVSQGEVIGYVGMTGWATGPHLHYEFRIDGQQHDPLRVALPDASPISEAQKAAFQSATQDLVARLGLLQNTSLAQLD